MARNEELERRCLNWARWKNGEGQGGLGYGGGGWNWTGADRSAYREAKVPTLDVEAEQTDRAVMALPSHLRRTVEVYYLGEGSMDQRCAQLQISRPTLYVRIDKAHEEIAAWLRQADSVVKHEAERVALLQASARPKGPSMLVPGKRRRRVKGSFKD